MILTCPECATRFFADDDAIGVRGRTVKCAACGHVWLGMNTVGSEPVDLIAANEAAISPGPIVAEPPATSEGVSPVAAPLFVERSSTARKAKARSSGASWTIGLFVIVVAIVVGLLAFPRQVERVFPGAATVYRSVGLDSAGG